MTESIPEVEFEMAPVRLVKSSATRLHLGPGATLKT